MHLLSQLCKIQIISHADKHEEMLMLVPVSLCCDDKSAIHPTYLITACN